ncbi:MAG: chemotaxis protein CheD [Eubacteriales bacterium]|jgi:chemotaxis protein CheD|nr:chemotaxis protein CheD [Eubacteriales bacterium]MDD3289477.1 chemotaxis protein CheD [Eubacteriales bacterium]MDD3863219.1 chemotaxis protein CheD [Eubacteriales bacterium]MDD4444753.1 chemotaxis protein CheD [Eubacteriales bacterium]
MSELLTVGISDYKTGRAPLVIVTYALGSCIGICLYDQVAKIGGLSHIMLPDSKMFTQSDINRMKFADTAIPDMLNVLCSMGADRRRITAKIAGGAQMFKVQEDSPLGMIGTRNTRSVKAVLSELRIPIVNEDTGADYGRTLYFDLQTGNVRVQSLNKTVVQL